MHSFTGTVGNEREEVPKSEAGGGACGQKANGRSWMDRTTDVHFSLPKDLSSFEEMIIANLDLQHPPKPNLSLVRWYVS